MTDKELKTLFRVLGRDLDARQRAQLQRLRRSERELYNFLVLLLSDRLTVSGGRITSRISDAVISRAVEQAFREVQKGALKEVHASTIKDLKDIIRGNATYYQQVFDEEGRSGFGATKQKTLDRLLKRLGIDGNTLVKGGYLARYFSQRQVHNEVTNTISSAIGSRARLNALFEQLALTIKGTRNTDGAITRQYAELITDTYHRVDRQASDDFGAALKFKWFSYEGGLIETSRRFCIDRDGQVFNTVESERWRKDPTLPKTTKERESGVIVNYVPWIDMGRWNCRHRARWISEQMARRLAPHRFN